MNTTAVGKLREVHRAHRGVAPSTAGLRPNTVRDSLRPVGSEARRKVRPDHANPSVAREGNSIFRRVLVFV